MRGADFDEIAAFAAIAEQGSFAKAATLLGLAVSTLSHRVRRLEERLGVRLFNRTTRSVALTQAGEAFLAQLRPALTGLDGAVAAVRELRHGVAGRLGLTVAPPAADTLVAPLLAGFLAAYPAVTLEIAVGGARLDIVKGRFDAGIRLGSLVERDMIAVRLGGPVRPTLVASPGYLARAGRPETPEALQAHRSIRIRLPDGTLLPWRFQRDGEPFEVRTEGALVVDDRALELGAALDGAGIACVLSNRVARHLADGRLVSLLEPWMPPASGFYLYYPSRRQMPSPLRAFIDFARSRAGEGAADPP